MKGETVVIPLAVAIAAVVVFDKIMLVIAAILYNKTGVYMPYGIFVGWMACLFYVSTRNYLAGGKFEP